MQYIPSVIETLKDGSRVSKDIFSSLLDKRIILLNGEVNENSAGIIISSLFYLDSKDNSDIDLYINSNGGSVDDGYAIYDVMNFIKSNIRTTVIGKAYSMGAFLLSGGEKGKRYATKNSSIMIHQPLGGTKGQASDILIHAERIIKLKEKLTQQMAENCSKDIEQLKKDMERDYFMNAEEALNYGIIDKII